MTTPYIDPNLIFAENAPTQDKPAAFENYDKGWDESRKNDGRPSIKQMNYLQQQADLKNLYIHENGAALPYKEGIAYEEGAVVVKDGELQQWKGGVWVNVGARKASDITDASGVTQQEINEGLNSISDLLSIENLYNGLRINVRNYHNDGFGVGGYFVYSAELSKSLHDGGCFIDPSKTFPTDWADQTQQDNWFNTKNTGTGVFVRVQTGVFNVEQWGVRGDGVAEEDIVLNAIVRSIPEGATLHMIDRTCTILVDAPTGQSENPCAWGINKKIKIIGTVGCTVKIKDFCSAWTDFTTTLDVVQITASGAEVIGLRVDANSDNHYQLDSNGFKWWEAAPAPLVPKRPPNGIVTRCKTGQPNVKDVVMAFNTILRPLGGIVANGSYGTIYSQEFYDKKLSVGCVQNVKAFGNTVIRARGNDFLMSNGAVDCHFYNNKSQLGYYHYQRMYQGCIGCQMTNNDAVYNYNELAILYNSSDNGYWRTSNPAYPEYKIVRSGVRIGSSYVEPNENGGNIRDSFISGGTMRYNGGLSAIMDESSTQAAATSLQNVGYNCEIFGMTVYDNPSNTAVFINTGVTITPPEGCAIRDNEYYRCRVGVIIQSDNATFSGNKLVDCSIVDASHIITAVKENPRVYDNEIFFTVAQPNSRRILSVTEATTGLIDNNRTKNIRPQVLISNPNAQIFGSNGNGAKINLVSSYTEVADSRINTVSNSLINLSGEISSTNAVSVIASLDTVFRPVRDQKFAFIVVSAGTETTVGEVFVGTVTTLGQFRIDLKGKVNIGTLSFNFNYPSNFIS